MDRTSDRIGVWWGKFTLTGDQSGFWRIGPMKLWLRRLLNEWRIAHCSEGDPNDGALEVRLPVEPREPGAEFEVVRFFFRQPPDDLSLLPAPADRPVIIRSETPLCIPANEEITLYVSTPLWVRLQVGRPEKLLLELPLYRPSDTWFGPNTREGEIAYAGRTQGRLHLEDLPFRPHRAVTPVLIRNLAEESLLLERINVPVPYLSLFSAADGGLWTQGLTLEREAEKGLAVIYLDKDPPRQAPDARPVCGPRERAEQNLLKRTFGALFG